MFPQLDPRVLGHVEGQEVLEFTLAGPQGLRATVSELGAALTSLLVPDENGTLADVVLGFDSLEPCLATSSPYFGVTVGRVANRIRDGRCEVEGRPLPLARNDGPHHLHGGKRGLDKRIWKGRVMRDAEHPSVEFRYHSPAGEEGYPGDLDVTVRYSLTDDGALGIEMTARTSELTPVNLAHHSYWNLEGHDQGDVLDHELQLHASRYTPGDPVPDGRVLEVGGTPFDFRSPKRIGADLEQAGATPIGFDHNWLVDGAPGTLRPVAHLRATRSGRQMILEADQPGVQFYSGNFLDGSHVGKGGIPYPRHAGLCLETQCPPNAINVPEWRDGVLLAPGDEYRHRMVHRFNP